MKKIGKNKIRFSLEDYIKANKIAARNEQLENGFVPLHKVHKSKKAYNRQRDRKVIVD